MRRTTWKQIGVGAIVTLLAVGCASGTPQRSPGAGTGNTVQGSTTGDLDACSVALGNMATTGTGQTGTAPVGSATGTTAAPGVTGTTAAPGMTGTAGSTALGAARLEVTANGLMIGNVALVALPENDNMPLSPTAGGGGTTVNPPGTAAERTGSTGATAPGTKGTTDTTGTAAGGMGAVNVTAMDRIRSACRGVTEIRIVSDRADRARLAQATMAMRKGVPVTEYMEDLAGISRRAALYGSTTGAGGGGGGTPAAPVPATPAPARTPTATPPDSGHTMTPPGASSTLEQNLRGNTGPGVPPTQIAP